jgi:hypothetical protein
MFAVCVLSEISIAKCSSVFILFESGKPQNNYSATCYVDNCDSCMLQFRGGIYGHEINYERETSGFLNVVYENSDLLECDIEHLNQLRCRFFSQTFLFMRFARVSYRRFIATL